MVRKKNSKQILGASIFRDWLCRGEKGRGYIVDQSEKLKKERSEKKKPKLRKCGIHVLEKIGKNR